MPGPSEAEIRAELAAEEEDSAALTGAIGLHAVSPSGMLANILELEEQQYVYYSVHGPENHG